MRGAQPHSPQQCPLWRAPSLAPEGFWSDLVSLVKFYTTVPFPWGATVLPGLMVLQGDVGKVTPGAGVGVLE